VSHWPLNPFVDYITSVPFGPCAEGSTVRFLPGTTYNLYDGEQYFKFKRVAPLPELTFEETHPDSLDAKLYFSDFLEPLNPVPPIKTWPFKRSITEDVNIEPEILSAGKGIILAERRKDDSWWFSAGKKEAVIQVPFGDLVSSFFRRSEIQGATVGLLFANFTGTATVTGVQNAGRMV